MSDHKYEARLSALNEWAALMETLGYVPPSPQDLATIAETKNAMAPGLDAMMVPWQGAIKELLKQVMFNISEPHLQLGPEFHHPEGALRQAVSRKVVPEEISEQAASAPESTDMVFRTLKAWKDKAELQGQQSIKRLKDTHLRQVMNSKFTTADEIRSVLPGSAGEFAEEIQDILQTVNAVPTEAQTPEPTPAREPQRIEPAFFTSPKVEEDRMDVQVPTPKLLPQPIAVEDITRTSFAAFDYSRQQSEPSVLRVLPNSDGIVQMEWAHQDAGAPVKIYRVISHDEHPPYNPDQAELVCITREPSATDERSFTSSVRYLQVWLNEGESLPEALGSQPILLASQSTVAPVSNLEIREDEGRVIGQWASFPNTQKVQIFRIPIEKAAYAAGDAKYRIALDSANLNGFVDSAPIRGANYLYQVQAEAQVENGTKLSVPISRPVRVSAVLSPVTDLRITLHQEQGDQLFDLLWSPPPGGRVVVYRTERPPTPGLERTALSEDALELNELKVADRLAHPIEESGDFSGMASIPWPSEWNRAYFTPVTLLEDKAFVGTTISKARIVNVRNPRILERASNQILTFEWPEGANSVMVYQGPTGQDAESALSGQPQEVSHSGYQQYGGMLFRQVLPDRGCDVHLVPVTFEAGNRTSGSPTTVSYPGLLSLMYRIAVKKNFLGKVTGASVSLLSASPVSSVPPFVLVFREDRLPLSARDGIALNMQLDVDGASPAQRRFVPEGVGTPNAAVWKTESDSWGREVGKKFGYLRLFADLPPEASGRVALLDPPVATLQMGRRPAPGQRNFDGR